MSLIKNQSVYYEPESNRLLVCRNYIHSKQVLKEDFRRENVLAHDNIVKSVKL